MLKIRYTTGDARGGRKSPESPEQEQLVRAPLRDNKGDPNLIFISIG